MTTQVFGCGVNADVGTVFKRALDVRGRERVVDRKQRPGLPTELGDRLEVEDLQKRVGRRFGYDQSGFFFKLALQLLKVGHIDGRESNPQVTEDFGEQAIGSAVDVVGDQYPVSGYEGQGERGNRCHSGPECERVFGPFKRSETRFERLPGGIVRSGVLKSFVFRYTFLNKCRCLIERNDRSTGSGVWILTHMDGGSFEAHTIGHNDSKGMKREATRTEGLGYHGFRQGSGVDRSVGTVAEGMPSPPDPLRRRREPGGGK